MTDTPGDANEAIRNKSSNFAACATERYKKACGTWVSSNKPQPKGRSGKSGPSGARLNRARFGATRAYLEGLAPLPPTGSRPSEVEFYLDSSPMPEPVRLLPDSKPSTPASRRGSERPSL